MEAKPFSIGFRIEHPRGVIDRARWGKATQATRCWVRRTTSWCTTPAMAARCTASACARAARWWPPPEPGRVVTNGMSQYSRNERNANAGMVVSIDPKDYPTDAAAWLPPLGEAFGELPPPPGRNSTRWRASCCNGGWSPMHSRWAAKKYLRQSPGRLVGIFWPAGRPVPSAACCPRTKPGRLTRLHEVLPPMPLKAMQEALPVRTKIRSYDMPGRRADRRGRRHLIAAAHHARGDDFKPEHAGLYPACITGEGLAMQAGFCRPVDGIKV